jgi:hypothetical protein
MSADQESRFPARECMHGVCTCGGIQASEYTEDHTPGCAIWNDPCYVCGVGVPHGEGWRCEGKAWCAAHQPVWSRT